MQLFPMTADSLIETLRKRSLTIGNPALHPIRQSARQATSLILALALPLSSLLSAQPLVAATPNRICQGSMPLSPQHPDVKALQQLIQRAKLQLSTATDLGETALTRFEFALALAAVLQQSGGLTGADQELLQTLQTRYASDLALLSSSREGGRYSRPYGGYSSGNKGKVRAQMPSPGMPPLPVSPMPGISPPSPRQDLKAAPQAQAQNGSLPNVQRPIGEPLGDRPEAMRRRPNPDGSFNTESYQPIDENPFQRPRTTPLSTFSIDVDTASYSNTRRLINSGQAPPKDAVRIEELINYFPYRYAQPQGQDPFSVNLEVGAAPWNPQHKLVQVGLRGQQLTKLPPSNLVFLVDVSGSMDQPNRLPMVKQSLCLLVNQLSTQDRVTLVTYAGSAGLVLPPTPGDQKATIMAALDRLEAGGSTAGGAGIELAYKQAQEHLIKGGNNRVILATDGDFNVGASSDAELVRMIEQKRDRGIYLSILGFGMGNYKDSKMEALADKGNGNYAYIDTMAESRKVLVNDLRGTLFTIAKDVKIQVEFNPDRVQAYRLIGYENRALRDQDFNDDKKDAGEIGAGHTVTALYEIIPTGIESDVKLPSVDPLKYGTPPKPNPVTNLATSYDLMQVKLRYKLPNQTTSSLITRTVADPPIGRIPPSPSLDFQFSSSVALFGMVLRDSEYKNKATVDDVLRLATAGRGEDQEGYRSGFIRLVQRYQSQQNSATSGPETK
jgi:Ca-activated chloride channel homolog